MKIGAITLATILTFAATQAFSQNANDAVEASNPIVAILNGEPVLASEVVEFYESLGPDVAQVAFQSIYPQLLESTVSRKLVNQMGRSQGLLEDEEAIRKIQFWTERVIEEIIVNRWVESNLTDDLIQVAYEAMIADITIVEEVRASHILVETQEEGYEAIVRIENGELFADLARELSTGPSGAEGGDLDFFKYEDVIPEFSDIAFSLPVGEYTTEPVETQFGWHIILVTDRRSLDPPSYEESYDSLRQQEGMRLLGEFYESLKGSNQIILFNFDGTPAGEEGPIAPVVAPAGEESAGNAPPPRP